MAREAEEARVTLVAVKGSALFEIRQLFAGWVALDAVPSIAIATPAVAVLCGDLSVLLPALRNVLEVPILRVGIGQSMLIAPFPMHTWSPTTCPMPLRGLYSLGALRHPWRTETHFQTSRDTSDETRSRTTRPTSVSPRFNERSVCT